MYDVLLVDVVMILSLSSLKQLNKVKGNDDVDENNENDGIVSLDPERNKHGSDNMFELDDVNVLPNCQTTYFV